MFQSNKTPARSAPRPAKKNKQEAAQKGGDRPAETRSTTQQRPSVEPGITPFPAVNNALGMIFSLAFVALGFWIWYVVIRWVLGFFGIGAGLFRRQPVETEKGSAHFAEEMEIKHLLKPMSQVPAPGELVMGKFPMKSRIMGRTRYKKLILPRDLVTRHVLIAAPTGAGKSSGFFLPNLVFPSQQSLLITDVKSELWNHTSGIQTNPIRFAPMEEETSCFNWIPLCKNPRIAARCAEAIAYAQGMPKGDPFWINGELRILAAVFSHCAYSDVPTPAHAYELLNTDVNMLAKILHHSNSPNARRASVKFAKAKEDHKNSFTDSAANKMQWMEDPNIRRFTSSSLQPFDFGRLRHTPTQVYWCLRQTDVTGLKPLTTLFFNLAKLQLLDEEGTVPVTFFLDELANIGKLHDLENDISLVRGQNIGFVAALQDRSQLVTNYGPSQATTIMSQFNNKVGLMGLDGETAKYFSELLGSYTYTDIRTSRGRSSGGKSLVSSTSTNESYYTSERRLMTPDEVRRIEKGEALLVSTNLAPIKLETAIYKVGPETVNKARSVRVGREIELPVIGVGSPLGSGLPELLDRAESRGAEESWAAEDEFPDLPEMPEAPDLEWPDDLR